MGLAGGTLTAEQVSAHTRGALREEGVYACLWATHVLARQKATQHCTAIILQLEIIFFFLNEGYCLLLPLMAQIPFSLI